MRTDIGRIPTISNEIRGIKQQLVPIQNMKDLIIALSNIAFSDHVREDQYTQTTRFNSFVLDVLVKVRNKKLPVPKGQLGIASHFSRSNDEEVSTITASTTTKRTGGRKRVHIPIDRATKLHINLVAPTWQGKIKGGGESV